MIGKGYKVTAEYISLNLNVFLQPLLQLSDVIFHEDPSMPLECHVLTKCLMELNRLSTGLQARLKICSSIRYMKTEHVTATHPQSKSGSYTESKSGCHHSSWEFASAAAGCTHSSLWTPIKILHTTSENL